MLDSQRIINKEWGKYHLHTNLPCESIKYVDTYYTDCKTLYDVSNDFYQLSKQPGLKDKTNIWPSTSIFEWFKDLAPCSTP